MKQSISTQDLKSRIGEVMDAVRLRGDRYIVERKGRPVAALVPLSVHESYERHRRELFALMDDVAQRHRDLAPEQIEAMIEQAINEVRRKKRGKKRAT